MSATECPVCGADAVAACATPGGSLMHGDHPGRPPYFSPEVEAALDVMGKPER